MGVEEVHSQIPAPKSRLKWSKVKAWITPQQDEVWFWRNTATKQSKNSVYSEGEYFWTCSKNKIVQFGGELRAIWYTSWFPLSEYPDHHHVKTNR
jgi:hypothetical protein